ncbi:MAG: hypothetical protein WAN86_21975 [Hyphomicrobiaceae bacterium]
MSTLTYTNQSLVAAEAAAAKPARKPLLTRMFNAFVEAQQRRAEREIARYLAGRPLTDDVERELMRRLSGAKPL